jgi:carboxyl-terminal processing protease
MRGKAGTKVRVTIRRRGKEKLLNFELSREIIDVASVSSKSLAGNIAYIRLKQFQAGTHTELLENIGRLRGEQAIEGVILDLRNNPGGLVNEAMAIADEFLNAGIIYTTRARMQIVDEVTASTGGALSQEPLVVLVNEYSASASELVAGALQDHGRGSVIGAPTFGKGSVQSILDLPGGAALRLTTMRYYTPSGRAIQAQGIQPDVQVEAAYVADTSFGVTRESDLDNHLPPEGTPGTPGAKEQPLLRASDGTEEDVGVSPTHLGVLRVVPKNPSGGPEFALSIGYQILRGILTRPR